MDMEHQAVVFSPPEQLVRPVGVLQVVPSGPAEMCVSAALLWSELCQGTTKIRSFSSDECHTRVVLERPASPGISTTGRRLRALELLFQGVTQSAIAIELGVAPSTVCADLKTTLVSLGVGDRAFALPPLLPQIWRLAMGSRHVRVCGEAQQPGCQTVLLPRVDLTLPDALAPAEVAVCRLLLEGRSHEQISRARRRKPRTIANQLAAVFAKLKVSGRLELVAELARHSSEFVDVAAT